MWSAMTRRVDGRADPRRGAVGVPRRPQWLLDRPRLGPLLQTGAPVTRVAAPAGAGKTALLIGWANASRDAIVWFNALRQEAELRDHVEAGFASVLQDRSDTGLEAPPDAAAPLTVVIDNGDHLDEFVVSRLLDELDSVPSLRIVVAGRDLRRFAAPSALMRHAQTLVGPADLDFSLDETVALLRAAGVIGQDDTIGLLHSLSGGNAAVLRAAIVALGGPGEQLSPFEATQRIIDLVASAVMPDHRSPAGDEEFRQFLRDTALAETMDRLLAVELSGVAEPELLFDRAVGMGLGSWLDDQTFAYSGAARMVLRRDAEHHDAERARRLGRRAARWARERGRAQAAFRLAISSGDFTTASRQLRDDFFELIQRSRDETRSLLESVPVGVMEEHPSLAYHLAVIYSADRQRRPRAIELLASTLRWLSRSSDDGTTADRLTARAIAAVSCRLVGTPARGVDAARAALQLSAELGPAEVDEFGGLPGVIAHCGLTLLYAGEYAEGLAAIAQGASLTAPFSAGRLLTMSMMAGAQALLGEMPEAAAIFATLDDDAWSPGMLVHGSRLVFLAESLLAIEQDDPERAEAAVGRIDADRERFAPNDHWELNTYVAALVAITARQPARAVELITSAGRRRRGGSTGGPLVGGLLTAARATAELAAGNPFDALATLESDGGAGVAGAIARARVDLALDQPADAIAGLAAIDSPLTTRQRAEATAIDVAARLRLSTDHAAAEIPRLMAILLVHGLRTPLALLPEQDVETILALAEPPMVEQLGGPVVSLLQPADVVHLSPREIIVLGALAQTGSAAEIAEMLYVSVSTVKSQLRSIYRKLGVRSRQQALARAAQVVPAARSGPNTPEE